jgi:hypothetical protein
MNQATEELSDCKWWLMGNLRAHPRGPDRVQFWNKTVHKITYSILPHINRRECKHFPFCSTASQQYCLLGYNNVQSGISASTYQRDTILPYSEWNSKPSKTVAWSRSELLLDYVWLHSKRQHSRKFNIR